MPSCEELHPLILDSLYGLLEPDEEQLLRAHVAECPQCQTAQVHAKREQNLFARAAQSDCVVAPFVAPSEEVVPSVSVSAPTPAPDSPAVLQLPLRQRRPAWQRWAMVAAAASVVLTGVALHYQYEEKLDGYRQTSRRASRDAEAFDAKIAQVQHDFDKAIGELPADVAKPFIHVNLIGPAEYHRDTPAGFRVTTRDVQGQPASMPVTCTLVNGEEKRLLAKIKSNGDTQIEVPADLAGPVGPTGEARKGLRIEVTVANLEKSLEARLNREAPQHVTHVALNKGSYRIGDVLFVRTLTLQRYSLKPPAEPIPLTYTLHDSTGKVRLQKHGVTGPGGIGGGEFALGNDIQDGDYILEVAETGSAFGVAPQRRRVEIQRGLNPELHFDRAHYKPGDSGVATYRGRRLEGGKVIAEQPLFGNITVNGKPLPGAAKGGAGPVALKTDEKGVAKFPFHLPENLDGGKAVIVVEEADKKAKVEQAIPVVVTKRMVDFFPEGGELVAGVPTRVYYRVRTPAGEPVPPEGHVILISTKTGDVLLDSRWGQGVGVFTLTPDPNDTYKLRITWPKKDASDANEKNWDETDQPFAALPPIRSSGVALGIPAGVSREGEALRVVLQNRGAERRVLVLATCRGRVVDQQLVDVPASAQVAKAENSVAGKAEVKLQPVSGAAGVIRVTVFELRDGRDLVPMAERLVYRLPAHTLRVSVRSNQAEHHGGDKAYFQVKATTENGQSVFAYGLGIAVEQKAAPRQAGLPAHFYLLSEVEHGQDLDNADFVVNDTPEPIVEWFPGAGLVMGAWDNIRRLEKYQALDLFLGTHGWRRFADDKADKLEAAVVAKAEQKRVQELRTADRTMIQSVENMSPDELSRLYRQSLQRREEELRLRASGQLARLTADREDMLKSARAATLALADLEHKPRELLRLGVGILTVVLVSVGGLLLALGVFRLARHGSARPALAGAMVVLFFALAVYGLVGTRLERDAGPHGDATLAHLKRPTPTLADSTPPRPAPAVATSGLFAASVRKLEDTASSELKDVDGRDTRGSSLASAKKQNAMDDTNVGGMNPDTMADDKTDVSRSKEYLQFYAKVEEQQKRAAADYAAREKELAEKNMTTKDKDTKKIDPGFKSKKANPGKNDKQHTAMLLAIPTAPPREFFTQEFVATPVYQDTILWSPSLRFPDEVSFVLPPQAATYRIFLYANSPTGRLGYYHGTLSVK